ACFMALFGFIGALNHVKKNEIPRNDNNISIGALIELAKYFKKNPKKHINFIFLLTGARTIKASGANDFIKRHENEFNKDFTFFINLNTCTCSSMLEIPLKTQIPSLYFSRKLISLFKESSKEQKIPLKIRKREYTSGDFLPPIKKGFNTVVLNFPSHYNWKGKKLETDFLKIILDGLSLCINIIEKIDKERENCLIEA
ncbi:MAG: M28 family peptidase, partial [Promethearchaeota archaeon]